MKRILSLVLFLGICGGLSAQNIVTTVWQHKSAVLEEYTGIKCVYCPDGHKIAKQIRNDYPNRVLLVNIHEGPYANPSPGQPDYRTPYGSALSSQTGLTGYPAGTMNRHVFPSLGPQPALSRGSWRDAAEEIMQEVSPVNVGATTSYDPATRQLTINLEVYYTMDAASSTNKVNIALLQDSILGPQTGAANFNPGDIMNGQYVHGNMLRDFVTGQWGDLIPNTTRGSLYTNTYTYTIPNDVNGVPVLPEHCHLAIYVTETQQDILQGISLDIENDTNDGNHAPYYGGIFSGLSDVIQKGGTTPSSFTTNLDLSVDGTYEVELITDAPSDWSASFTIDGITYTSKQTLALTAANSISAEIEVTPGSTPALANYTLKAVLTGSNTAEMEENVYVISGITDLIVNSSGSIPTGATYNWQPMYEAGLDAASNTTYGAMDAGIMEIGFAEGALDEIENIYLNVGWSFPAITDDQADELMSFMDGGGNLFIAGQDIGWSMNTSRTQGGYQTPTTFNFYKNYLNADYKADGNTLNNQLTAVSTDPIFGTHGSSTIVDRYSNNFYPDEFDPINGAASIFNYNGNANETAGIRFTNGTYKVVYLGVGIEMIQDVNMRTAIVETAHNWFNGITSTEEFDQKIHDIMTWPNPVHDELHISTSIGGEYKLTITDIKGSVVMNKMLNIGNEEAVINISTLPNGTYTMTLSGEGEPYKQVFIRE